MQQNHFDFIIIGNGLAGLQLALEFSNESYFNDFKFALIDSSSKSANDKTWSFWEQGVGKWESCVHKQWDKALFYSKEITVELNLSPYQYKSIRSLDFYHWAKSKLSQSPNFHFILDEIQSVNDSNAVTAIGKEATYMANHIFDSRIPKEFYNDSIKYTKIHQHFKGWIIETDTPIFDKNCFTMMDYRYSHKNSTSFIYVLPFSETQALVEFTFFTPYLVEESVYDAALKDYLHTQLKITNPKILEKETGNIPMTDFPFWKFNTKNITKIGTGGGWVKGSSGYSFKLNEKKVAKIVQNIKEGKHPDERLFKKKFRFYDKIFLDVLKHDNALGPWIFQRFYSQNSVSSMFRFLDEETTFKEDLGIMQSLLSFAFIKALFRTLFR